MISDDSLFKEDEWLVCPDIKLQDEVEFLQQPEEIPAGHALYYNPYEIQEEIKILNDDSFTFNESESLFLNLIIH